MDLRDALVRRRMVRSFTGEPVDVDRLAAMCEDALRAPTAGNARGTQFVVVAPPRLGELFAVATDESWRTDASRAPGLLRAGAAVLAVTDPSAYLARYGLPDKDGSGLDVRDGWPIPYWHTDAAMATMALLLLVEEAGWGACLWGAFRHARAILDVARADEDDELFATVLVGVPDASDRPSRSLELVRRPRRDRVRRLL